MKLNHDKRHEKSPLYFNYKNLNDIPLKIPLTNQDYQQLIH